MINGSAAPIMESPSEIDRDRNILPDMLQASGGRGLGLRIYPSGLLCNRKSVRRTQAHG